jgi:hypothetical protein
LLAGGRAKPEESGRSLGETPSSPAGPTRRKRSRAEREGLKETGAGLKKMLDAENISEEEILADFKR